MSKKYTIELCNELATKRNGRCLSINYVSCRSKLEWQCAEGHTWTADLFSIKNCNTWCPTCSGHIPNTLLDCDKVAISRNGQCISNQYVSNKSKLRWRCQQGHEWNASFNKIVSANQWCPQCQQERARITSIQRYGTDNPMKNSMIALKSACNLRRSVIRHWQTNEELNCASSWENKVIDFLNKNKVCFIWQPKTFILSSGLTYRPDLYLIDADLWVEIKGFWRGRSQEKWIEFHTILQPNSELWDKDKLLTMHISVR